MDHRSKEIQRSLRKSNWGLTFYKPPEIFEFNRTNLSRNITRGGTKTGAPYFKLVTNQIAIKDTQYFDSIRGRRFGNEMFQGTRSTYLNKAEKYERRQL